MAKCTNCIDYLSEPKEKYAGLCQRCHVAGVHDFQSRIASLEAERDKAVELLREIVPSSKCDFCYPSYCWPHGEKAPCPIGEAQAFLASIGGGKEQS